MNRVLPLLVVLLAAACGNTPADYHQAHAPHDAHEHREAPVDTAGSAVASDSHAGAHGGGGDHTTEDEATPAQRAAAERLVAETTAGVGRFADLAAAEAEGYRAVTPESLPVVHYLHPGYLVNDDVLDPDHPESLVYARAGDRSVLLGAMFLMPAPGIPGPQVGGPLTVWHTHDDLCIDPTAQMVVGFVDARGGCPHGAVNTETPEMLHVWVVDNPDGPFAHDMSLAGLLHHLATAP